ncbi:MAG TPA: tRNA uridine-5-carboxymethylaminomethyl(34) synthesis GTPase MnmE, partial [Pseudolabrys sp.]|nr:tRNA uridine-5-carboxymethylaminomethyl(34) synthesis GTPase MnmE [Pseudolabrys sp.]
MSDAPRDTIFALSSGRPPAAIAVIRIAGPRARAALEALGVKVPEPRKVGLARFRDPASAEIIDEGLVLFFEAAKSEVGEDTAELQPHGGRAIIAALLAALGRVEGLRPAEAGEFTRRAFENGKLDLTAVEGLADLVMAETEGQRRQAYRQMRGVLGKQADAWREKLIQALALVEARIDFSDESDVPEELLAPAVAIARELEAEIGRALADGHRGERLREGLVVAIAGPPNAGKSTLLNRIARREAAIVSPYAGTTRDVIEVHLDLGGMPVTLLDTAGIRDTDDPVEMEGVRRAQARAADADLVLWVVDATEEEPPAPQLGAGTPPRVWLVRNKVDLDQELSGEESTDGWSGRNEPKERTNDALNDMVTRSLTGRNECGSHTGEYRFSLSAATGAGLSELLAALERDADEFLSGSESSLVTRARHRKALEDARAALGRATA